ncbi:hypothetical protein DFQ28_000898 [Apophysomyces sp. BC1034]|nr:hypothetical protein DFQ30_001539 [Apophysomyces sp. BC1015]KAG0166891.1 hypothetical protein DFQ29_000755 [Apophysomyces sp. BC1021]KAG0183791.1 hypothetical protein DFQ28_000898 [Apophysomyces sp. BC1034]
MATFEVGLRAYTIPLLHAAKHPAQQVSGVLLGRVDGEKITVSTALSLFHHWTAMTPMLEAALQEAEIFASQKNLQIVGWYQANARHDDSTLHEDAIRVANVIRQHSKQAIIFVVDNEQLASLSNNAILPYIFSENQWRCNKQAFTRDSSITLSYEDTLAKVRGMFSTAAYHRIVDFDDHLEDVSRDWLGCSTFAT